MQFVVKKIKKDTTGISVVNWEETANLNDGFFSYKCLKKQVKQFSNNDETFFILGDLIPEPGQNIDFEFLKNSIENNVIHKQPGIFYLIYIHGKTGEIKVFSNLFHLLPIYFYQNNNEIVISGCPDEIIRLTDKEKFAIDKQYILERLFFNYGLFEKTYFKGIELVKANHYIQVTDRIKQSEQFRLRDLFTRNPKRGKNTLAGISQLFVDRLKTYLPEEKYALSFTGGFDGRTLLAVSLYLNKDFFTYAFGSGVSPDLLIPISQAKKLNIEFDPIILDEQYAENHAYSKGIELIEKSCGKASFSRAHYVYAANILSEKTNIMITGNFGSELFRAMHNPGVMISQELIDVFSLQDETEWIEKLKNSPKWEYLNQDVDFSPAFDQLVSDIISFKEKTKQHTTNEAFYIFVLNEVFRKYFGPEIQMQQHYLVNRAPFIDFQFIEELFKTHYCGVYSDFFTHNPVKRFKGQLLYAHILKTANSPLLQMPTGKGYRPSSLLTHWGKVQLAANLIRKKLKKGNAEADDFMVTRSFLHHKEKWSNTPICNEIYNENFIRKKLDNAAKADNLLINVVSSNLYLSNLLKNG